MTKSLEGMKWWLLLKSREVCERLRQRRRWPAACCCLRWRHRLLLLGALRLHSRRRCDAAGRRRCDYRMLPGPGLPLRVLLDFARLQRLSHSLCRFRWQLRTHPDFRRRPRLLLLPCRGCCRAPAVRREVVAVAPRALLLPPQGGGMSSLGAAAVVSGCKRRPVFGPDVAVGRERRGAGIAVVVTVPR